MPASRPLADRFWEKVDRWDPDACWGWTGAHANTGYGQIGVRGQRSIAYAHRVSHELLIGPIPAGYEIDHLCLNRGCVNPKHLEAVTHRENGLRRWRASDTCKRGHARSPENWSVRKNGKRECRLCMREAPSREPERRRAWERANYARRRAIARARIGIPGLSPLPREDADLGVSAGEPVPLVEQSRKREKDYGEPPG